MKKSPEFIAGNDGCLRFPVLAIGPLLALDDHRVAPQALIGAVEASRILRVQITLTDLAIGVKEADQELIVLADTGRGGLRLETEHTQMGGPRRQQDLPDQEPRCLEYLLGTHG